MIWYTNESGYLCALKLPEVDKCKMCGGTFKRSVQISSQPNAIFEDKCPGCGVILNTTGNVQCVNELCEVGGF